MGSENRLRLEDRIVNELMKVDYERMDELISYLKNHGFFNCISGEHDRWRHGTAQHSWRVYQYLRYIWENPNENERAESRRIKEDEIILAGLLHDIGKVRGCGSHATNGKKILEREFPDFVRKYPRVTAMVFFHHNHSEKHDRNLDKYNHTLFRRLVNRTDSRASGTAWNSTRFKEGEDQHGHSVGMDKLLSEAKDRSYQVLRYGMYLDYHYDFYTIRSLNRNNIVWNQEWTKPDGAVVLDDDFLSKVHRYSEENGEKKCCLIVGEKHLDDLMICSNLLNTLFETINVQKFKYAFIERDYYREKLLEMEEGRGILFPNVTFFRDGRDEGLRMVAPWTIDVMFVPSSQEAYIAER